ncbi:MAG: quinone-dependent dihydroorotate dehydrogenase [Anaerolineales bacterium]|nr:quinone-dependent dihydroorotate dehydrogenase [Anaerolineales bacterium]
MYPFFRSFLFRLDPETAHHLTLQLIRTAGMIPPSCWFLAAMFKARPKPVEVFGLTFKNPVGLAAGYDKDCEAIRGLSTLGFGHLELGTVTPRPQPGNPKPRIFRLIEDQGIINRMGFPGKGMEYAARALRGTAKRIQSNPLTMKENATQIRNDIVVGVNLGKNKDTPNEGAAGDYIKLMRTFTPLADYLTINISSPNTVGLRRLQEREMLEGLLRAVAGERAADDSPQQKNIPILVKLAPDLTNEELDDAVGAILDAGMDGIIATNTTISRGTLRSDRAGEQGGLSGRPLTALSDEILTKVIRLVNGRVPVIAVGGIMTPADARRKLDLGAALVQVYSGMIYNGPGLVKDIVKNL